MSNFRTESPCTSGRTPEESVCPHLHKDKKNERCANCEARIKYAVSENMLPAAALEQKEDPVVKEAPDSVPGPGQRKKKVCSETGCNGKVYAMGKCEPCYAKAYYRLHHPIKEKIMVKDILICDEEDCEEEVKARGKCQNHYRALLQKYPTMARKYRKDPTEKRTQINLTFGKEDNEARQIIREVDKIAIIEMRRLSTQSLYFLREGIERWKGNYKGESL